MGNNSVNPRTKFERMLHRIAGGDTKAKPSTKTERLLNDISERLDAMEEGGSGGSSKSIACLDSAIQNGGIGYSEPKILIKDAKSPAFDQENPESMFITVSPAVIELVPGEELTLHVSIPEYNVDEDVTVTVIEQPFYPGSSTVPIWVCMNSNEQELYGYEVVILNDYDDQGVLRGNKFACIYMTSSDGSTKEYHLPVFSISMRGETHKISPDMIEGQLLPVATAEDAGKVPTVQDDGSYALGQAGGGVNPVMVTITMSNETGGTWSGATWDELLSAFANNVALAYLSYDGADSYYWLNYKMTAGNETIVGLILGGSKINLSQDGTVVVQ